MQDFRMFAVGQKEIKNAERQTQGNGKEKHCDKLCLILNLPDAAFMWSYRVFPYRI